MKAFLSRSAIVGVVLLIGLIVFSATPSIADTPLSSLKPEKKETLSEPAGKFGSDSIKDNATATDSVALGPTTPYVATAYSLRGKTASGRMVSRGLIAADPHFLPLGTRVRLDHPGYSGEYLVADTGGAIRGRRIDIWTPTSREAMRFGRRTVKLTVLSYGRKGPRRITKG
jgi:3D (Asp-Asp-Asp) domain-containing protein